MNVNFQVTVTDPQDYTEEVKNDFKRVSDSVQYIDATLYSFCIKAKILVIALTDMNINRQIIVTKLLCLY